MGQNDETKKQVIEICDRLFEKGFLAGTGGHVSVRLVSRMYTGIADTDQVIDEPWRVLRLCWGVWRVFRVF